jgi:chaperonin cofactor prefoldin
MSTRELYQELKQLRVRIEEIEKGVHTAESIDTVLEKIETLESKYKMLNARINKKNNGKEDG